MNSHVHFPSQLHLSYCLPVRPFIRPSIYLTCLLAGISSTPFSDKDPTQRLALSTILPPITTEVQSMLHTSPKAATQLLPMSTVSLSSPGLGVNPTQEPDVIRYGFQVSGTLIWWS